MRLTWVNHQAIANYEPKPYPGQVTLFRPQKFFAGYDDPEYGWGKVVQGGVDVHELPVYPKGILVEPLTRFLAEKLKASIEQAKARLT